MTKVRAPARRPYATLSLMPTPQPRAIYDALRATVIGQDEALREVSVALVKHLGGHPAPNILIVGNSGTGKTTLMKAVERWLAAGPDTAQLANLIRINANVLAEEHAGYGRAVLARLWANARRKLGAAASAETVREAVERGIVFIDEVDKIRAQVGETPNIRGIVAQEALLTLMENENIEFQPPEPGLAPITMNSSRMLFVAGGAFEDLYDSVLRRALTGTDQPPLRPRVVVSSSGEVREELPFHLRDFLRYDDLFQYGMTPQFLSRFESIIVLNDLVEEQLARIFVEPDGSIFRVSRDYFRQFDIDLQITRAAVRAIAWEASRHKRLGARALKEIFRKVIRDLEFAPAADAAARRQPRADDRRRHVRARARAGRDGKETITRLVLRSPFSVLRSPFSVRCSPCSLFSVPLLAAGGCLLEFRSRAEDWGATDREPSENGERRTENLPARLAERSYCWATQARPFHDSHRDHREGEGVDEAGARRRPRGARRSRRGASRRRRRR